MRSRTGCMTCRQRKLKCDEKRPSCGQCLKASRECVPSSGLIFRHQHNASMNGDQDSDDNNLRGFYAYKNTFDDENVWVDIPRTITFINTTDPYNDPPSPEPDRFSTASTQSPPSIDHNFNAAWPTPRSLAHANNTPSTNGLQALSAVATGEPFLFASPNEGNEEHVPSMLSPTTSIEPLYSPPMTGTNLNLEFMLNHPPTSSPPIDPNLPTSFPPTDTGFRRRMSSGILALPAQFDNYGEDDHEIAFLLRHFSEGPGYWMDLFDLDTYFASYVPVKAVENPLLKYAAVAYAAKALGRRGGLKPTMGGNFSRQARMELYPDIQSVDWYHKAAHYYDRAVCHLRQALQEESHTPHDGPDMEPSWAPNMEFSDDNNKHSHKRRRTSSYVARKVSNPDELLAATAILSVYEFLDASVPEWSRHLNGAKSLIDIAKERMMPLQPPSPGVALLSPQIVRLNKARKATFWNIARQDMLAAFINATHTRLDTEDLTLWKEAGLFIDSRGYILPSNTDPSSYPEPEPPAMKEDAISNALIWLISKLVNFMADGDDMPEHLGGPWAGVPQRTLLEYWYNLREHFEIWYEGLPVTFKPCARIEPRRVPAQLRTDEDENVFPEVWFSIPMCASTMQSYHMAQIQLLMNKPHESTQGRTTVFARLNSYEATLSAALVHSREIVSIALARSDESVRIHSVQPLYTAGQCLKDDRERRLILRLLRDIERDTGWATEYRVKQLLVQWGWVMDEFEREVP